MRPAVIFVIVAFALMGGLVYGAIVGPSRLLNALLIVGGVSAALAVAIYLFTAPRHWEE